VAARENLTELLPVIDTRWEPKTAAARHSSQTSS
jgi:hypothetical protein